MDSCTVVLLLVIMFVAAKYDVMAMVSGGESFLNKAESINTWEPSTSEFDQLSMDQKYKNYPEDLNANVDKAIIDSHANYLSDADFLASTGSSHASTNDHFTPSVMWHGLPRKAHYAQLGSERTSRVSQSETPEQVAEYAHHNSTDYIL